MGKETRKFILKTIRLFVFPSLFVSLILVSIIPIQSCEPEEEDSICDTCNTCDTCVMVYKPNIYIYPDEKSQMTVNINFPLGGMIVKSIPEYGKGWNISVDTNGLINGKYNYLFYESKQPYVWQENEGWIIKKADLRNFFIENMNSYGFRGNEILDFTDYWIPRLSGSELYAIYPQDATIINNVIELNFSKEPVEILRLFYVIKELNILNNKKMEEPGDAKPFKRNGYFVTEWGVILK